MKSGKDGEILDKIVRLALSDPLIRAHIVSQDNSPEYKNLISYQRLQARQKKPKGPTIVRSTQK